MPQRRRIPDFLATCAVALFMDAGLFSTWTTLNFHEVTTSLGTPFDALVQLALLLGLFALVRGALRVGGKPSRFTVLSGLCALCILLDRSFILQADWGLLFGSWRALWTALWTWAALGIGLWALLRIADAHISRLARAQTKVAEPNATRNGGMRSLFLYAGILLLCWMPHIVMQFPGHIETTAGQQIREAFGELPITDDNPLFHTLLLNVLLKSVIALGLGDTLAVFAVSLSQLIPLAFALTWTLLILKRHGVARTARNALLIFYGLCPLFPLYGLFIVKDVSFAIAVLLLTCVTIEVAYQKDAFFERGWRIALLIAIGAAVCLLRNAAVYLYAGSMLALFFAIRPKRKTLWRFLLCCAGSMMVFIGFTLGANALINIQTLETRQAETRSLQCQIIARVVREHGPELSQTEQAVIDACLPLEGLGSRYEPELSDPVKDTWRTDATDAQARALDALTARLALRYPGTALQAVLQIGIPYLTPGDIGRFRSVFDCGFSNIDALYPLFKPKHLFDARVFRSTLDYFQRAPLINFFCCGGIYAWLLLGSGAGLIRKRRWTLLAGFAPAFLVLLGCLFSPVAGYVRYALPFMICAPFLTLLTLRTLFSPVPETSPEMTATARRVNDP